LLLELAAFVTVSRAEGQAFSAEAVKAAFLHRFAAYVEWPPGALAAGPFVIAVAGADEVADHLDELLPTINVQGRPAVVRRITRPAELDGTHMLYVGPRMLARTSELRAAAKERPILLVTDDDDDFEGGGVINFVESDDRVRFEISLTAAGRVGLRIDSSLLPVAVRVEREPQARLLSAYPTIERCSRLGCLPARRFTAIRRLS
jgi:hypothetical protein